MTYHARILHYCEQQHKSYTELLAHFGQTDEAFRQVWETDSDAIDCIELIRIADFLSLPVTYLMNDPD